MNKKKVNNVVKKLTAGMLALAMVVVGMVVTPKQTDAAVVEDRVIYDSTYKIADYWKTDSKTAPVKEGYVFGGWYKSENENDYMTVAEAQEAVASGTTAYAKFVPAQVLSVKAQNMADTDENSTSTYVRVISSLDSKNYDKVGFDIWLANQVKLYKNNDGVTPLETDKIYDGLMVGTEPTEANTLFGGVSKYVSVWQLTNIDNAHFGKIIYVRPYWVTKDGTKVEGLAKYVHVEDQYKGYISVPVNILGGEKVAAGAVNMTYDTALQLADTEEISFEAGRLLPKMKFNYDSANNTIKMVGNAATVNDYNSGECIYANIRFKIPKETTSFELTSVKFCDWDEKIVQAVKVWDIKYVK